MGQGCQETAISTGKTRRKTEKDLRRKPWWARQKTLLALRRTQGKGSQDCFPMESGSLASAEAAAYKGQGVNLFASSNLLHLQSDPCPGDV